MFVIPFSKCLVLCVIIFLAHLAETRRQGRLASARGMRRRIETHLCYDLVGCFEDRMKRLSLKRPPESPSVIQTRFLLYTREKRNIPEVLQYGDEFDSIVRSQFNATKKLKVLIHGFKGSGSDVGAIVAANLLLDLEDINVIILDWTRGAGSSYGAAVANTELVGRQLALVLLDSIDLGVDPRNVHIVGFSLGAHVAGCASEFLKKKKILVGRITGLDPASPFFRHHLFREPSRKLDITDALFVDIVHTDGSVDFADGFGLLRPIGHVDFFPNGGREQPGCTDVKNSVVVSHFKEEVLDKNIACSHLRAWYYFMASLKTQSHECKLTAWPCPQGPAAFAKGTCFPMESPWSQELGYAADQGPLGIYYLATRAEEPFCGTPLRAAILTTNDAPKTSGYLFLKILLENSTTTFRIRSILPKRGNRPMTFYRITAGKYGELSGNLTTIQMALRYETDPEEAKEDNLMKEFLGREISDAIFLDRISIEDRKGNRWEYCKLQTEVSSREIFVELSNAPCEI